MILELILLLFSVSLFWVIWSLEIGARKVVLETVNQ